MSRKVLLLFTVLALFALLAAACQSSAEPAPVETVIVRETVVVTVEADAPVAAPSGRGEIFNRVKDRGRLVCGGRTDLPGFGMLDANGRNEGFDVDLCRAIAAAVLGDPEAIEIVPLTSAERGPALQTAEVDVLIRTATWTSSRDAQWGNFTVVMFYDGQGYMVSNDLGISSPEELDGATVCVTSGTTTELKSGRRFPATRFGFRGCRFRRYGICLQRIRRGAL